jgi:zinc transporter ZupT
MAVPAFLLVEWFEPVLPVGLGFAGGAMVWMVFAQLVPDALQTAGTRSVVAVAAASAGAMIALQLALLG